MFALRNKNTGKFLKYFGGSFNRHWSHVKWDIGREFSIPYTDVKTEHVWDTLFCLDTPDGAKVYSTETSAKAALYCWCNAKKPIEEKLPWLEIVPVTLVVKEDNPHREK